MKGILLISHGKMAEGMRNTLELFLGKVEQLDTLCLDAGQEISDFGAKLSSKLDALDSGEGVVVFCDLAFGTPANIVAKISTDPKFEGKLQIITGMNLPLVLEYSQLRTEKVNFNDMISVGKDGMINLNEKLTI